jgi:hypothetical protein|tara:strand:- start:800 stop:1498 length:699 start_codon:yes stop_codon:yes gene_type:complete
MATVWGGFLFLVVLAMTQKDIGFVAITRRYASMKLERHPTALCLLWRLFLDANYHKEPDIIMVAGLPLRLKRGEVLFDRARYASVLGVSEKAIRCAIKFLTGANITAKRRANTRANSCSIITLVDWRFSEKYDTGGANTESDTRADVGAVYKEVSSKPQEVKTHNVQPRESVPLDDFPPSKYGVYEYALTVDNEFINLDRFMAYCNNLGWRRNGKPLDWKAEVKAWGEKDYV